LRISRWSYEHSTKTREYMLQFLPLLPREGVGGNVGGKY
jgi:hypothetical protein